MFIKGSRRILLIIFAVVLILSIAGVYATWNYTGTTVPSISFEEKIDAFPWEGSEILPDDIEGQNHQLLIENIIRGTVTDNNGNTTVIGLDNPDSELSNQIEDRSNIGRDTFGSMDVRDSSEMANIFDLGTSKLAFMIHSPEDEPDVKYIYTTDGNLGESSTLFNPKDPLYPIGERIYPVYRTKIVRVLDVNGDYIWQESKTIIGSAESAFYANDWFGSWAVKNPAFDVHTFAPLYAQDCADGETAIAMGATPANAIYLYNGQSVNVSVAKESTITYFKYTATATGVVTLSKKADLNLIGKVYSDILLSTLTATNVGDNITFNAESGTTYYLEVSGTGKIEFTISQ